MGTQVPMPPRWKGWICTMSALDKIISQLPIGKEAASKKEEYIDKIIQVADKLTEAQVEYIYHLISQLFCQTAD